MNKPRLFIVFDQLPGLKGGGLVATYRSLVNELSDSYDINLLSIFAAGENDVPEFADLPIVSLSGFKIDNRFFNAIQYLKNGKVGKLFHAIASGIWFFAYRPFAKLKSRKLLEGQRVISSSPAASMFLSKKVKFIQEIHTYYEYFWGGSLIGRMQAKMMTPAELTLFRTKTDADKAALHMNASYIYNCFDDSVLECSGKVPTDSHRALFVGRLDDLKNPIKLVEYADELYRRDPDFRLDIYGTGNLQEQIEDKISELGLQEVVKLKGFVTDKTIYSKYAFMMMTSRVEGLPLVIVEAMANSIPTITSYWGDSVKEIVEDGVTGYIAKTDEEYIDKALSLLAGPNVSKAMGRNARIKYEEGFTQQRNKRRWLEILEEYG